jgi:putative RNA 2'-phosphotransferase
MKKNKSVEKLEKMLSYMLGRSPDEFALVPDPDGFFKIKEVLKALSEEEGWGYVRESHINEIFLAFSDPMLEIEGNLIRAEDREHLPQPQITKNLPKLLYVCIRRKACSVVYQKGIFPFGGNELVVLSSEPDMALRIGKRRDANPVMLTVQTQKAMEKGVVFYKSGDALFLCDHIPVDCFTGPPLPQENEKAAHKSDKPDSKKSKELPEEPKEYGSFFIDLDDEKEREKIKRKRIKKDIEWKKDAKKIRRRREKSPAWGEFEK